jgi:hypothetical protein
MVALLNSFVTVQALHAVAVLRIPDLLAAGPATVDALAAAASADAPSLHRVLRMLSGVGVVVEGADGRFSSTALGDILRSDNPVGAHDWAIYVGSPAPWAAWGRLTDSIATGEPGFVLAHGLSTYDYLETYPELASVFNRWMTQQSRQHNAVVVEAFDFSPYRTVADIGGGHGATMAAILEKYRGLRGILFDLPEVVAQPGLATADCGDRCDVVGGDMLDAVPQGADVYLMKRVLMTLGDDAAVRVLQLCAESIPRNGRVLAVEMIIPPGNAPSPAKTFDVLMLLANTGGRVRTEAELRDLFGRAGLDVTAIIDTSSPNSIVVGKLA